VRWISQKTLYGQVFNRSEKFIMEYEHLVSIFWTFVLILDFFTLNFKNGNNVVTQHCRAVERDE